MYHISHHPIQHKYIIYIDFIQQISYPSSSLSPSLYTSISPHHSFPIPLPFTPITFSLSFYLSLSLSLFSSLYIPPLSLFSFLSSLSFSLTISLCLSLSLCSTQFPPATLPPHNLFLSLTSTIWEKKVVWCIRGHYDLKSIKNNV